MAGDSQDATDAPMTSNRGVKKSGPAGAFTNAGWNGFSTIWSMAISFLLAPLLIHYLGVGQYGILLLIWSITGILGIASLGLGEATLRYVAHHYGNGDFAGVNRVFGATLSFYVAVCLVISSAMLIATPVVASLLKIPAEEYQLVQWLLRLSALVFSVGIISRALGSVPMALHRYDISSKIGIGQSVVRSVGYIGLVLSGFGLVTLVIWDVLTSVGTLFVQAAVIRRISPEIRLAPSFSFRGLREIVGYSVFSLLTYVFYTVFRESGKLLLGSYHGPAPVAFLGTPDNIAQRVHMVVASGSETLLPRFSANKDPMVAQSLFLGGTWTALAASIALFIPLVVLMPDFLRLWINPEFARESAVVGQLLALSYITQGAFAPPATFFRGIGKPWVVSGVMLCAGAAALLGGVLLIPSHGVVGAGYAYLIGSMAHFFGLLFGWFAMFGASAAGPLLRSVGVPLVVAGGAFIFASGVRSAFIDVNWVEFVGLGTLFVSVTVGLLFGADLLVGNGSHTKEMLERVVGWNKLDPLLRFLRVRRARW